MFNDFKKPRTPAPQGAAVVALASPAPRPQPVPAQSAAPVAHDWLELKSRLHNRLLDHLNLGVIDQIEEETLREEIGKLVTAALREEGRALRGEHLQVLIGELIHEVLGLGPLEPLLNDPSVDDILVNGHEKVYVERGGILERAATRFRDERHLLRIIDKIVSRVGRRIDESQPWVDARLEDGSRVNAIIRPCAVDGPSLSIRKFSRAPLTMDRLVANGALSDPAAALLRGLVQANRNIVVAGGTGSGKTTMLNALSSFIAPNERIVTIEDAAELQLQQEHVLRLETRPPNANGAGAVHQRDLLRNALRMRPDRIIVGEVRDAEAFDMLQAMNTGHEGSMTTIHANTPRDALGRIEQMVQITGLDLPHAAIRATIASAVHFVVQLNRLSDGTRRVTAISEITGLQGGVIAMQDIFTLKRRGRDAAGRILCDFGPTGIRPQAARDLIAAGIDLAPMQLSGGEA